MKKILTALCLIVFLGCSRTPQRIYYLTVYGNTYKKAAENMSIETLKNTLEKNTKLKFRENNKLTILQTGEKVLNRMFELIKNAETEICVDQYIFRKDEVGIEFFKILEEKADAGVKVRVIIDNIGSFKPSAYFSKKFEYSKIKARLYNPIFWWSIVKINNRDHNKILIVDKKIAVVSGIGLGKEFKYWRDIGVEAEGPIIYDIQTKFEETWIKAGYGWFGKDVPIPYLNALKLQFDKLFYKQPKVSDEVLNVQSDNTTARFLFDTPKFSDRATFETFLKIINSSKKYVYLTNAYFMPNIIFRNALTNAAKRGVDVKIILPSKSDLPFLRRSSQMFYKTLLKGGVKLYELKDNILHAKYMVIDDIWATIGSTNIIDRSFFMNMEANIEALDEKFAIELKNIFFDDLKNSEEITIEKWNNRSCGRKLNDYLFLPSILLY